MTDTVAKYMTPEPITVEIGATVREAAELMASRDIGDVVVVDDGRLVGIVTDRDLVVRVLAQGGTPEDSVRSACSQALVTTTPEADAAETVKLMRDHAVRRIPVVQAEQVVGVVSIGDFAIDRDPDSTLADISAERPNT